VDPTTCTISDILEHHRNDVKIQQDQLNAHEKRITLLEQNDLHMAMKMSEICGDVKWIREKLSDVVFKTGVQEGQITTLLGNATQGTVIGASASIVAAVVYGVGKFAGFFP
jgi:hypothetical protein